MNNKIITTKGDNAKCFLCGKEETLYYANFVEWVCKKDYDKINKFFDRVKKRHTRYKDANAWKGGHKL